MCSFECWKNSSSYESLPAGGLSFSLVLYFPTIPLPLSCNRPLLFFSFTFVHHRYCSFSSSCSISTQSFCPLCPLYSSPFSLPPSLIFVFYLIFFPLCFIWICIHFHPPKQSYSPKIQTSMQSLNHWIQVFSVPLQQVCKNNNPAICLYKHLWENASF